MAPVLSKIDSPGVVHPRATLLSLPPEILEKVYMELSFADLAQVAQVCRSLHGLATTKLYRDAVLTFYPNSGIDDIRSLERFTAMVASLARSSNDYASLIKSVSVGMDLTVQKHRMRSPISFPDLECTGGCAMYLNELIRQVLTGATEAVAFRWDIRTPLDPPVLAELGKLKHLRSLHIRLPDPGFTERVRFIDPNVDPDGVNVQWKLYGQHPIPPTLLEPCLRADLFRACDNLALMPGLRDLAILDIHSLDYVSRIGACVTACSGRLENLKLSFNEELGANTRDYNIKCVESMDYHGMSSQPSDSDLFDFASVVKMKPGQCISSPSAGQPKAIGSMLLAEILQVKLPNQADKTREASERPDDALRDFLETTHGLALNSLTICRVPVLHHVLIRGIDVTRLKHLSLLSVGPQAYIWAALDIIHANSRLRLTSIHTDSVSKSFLKLVSNLERVVELFIFRRKTLVDAAQVYGYPEQPPSLGVPEFTDAIFTKHMPHLQRLVLRNDYDNSWALDSNTAELFSDGVNLVELGVGISDLSCSSLIHQIRDMRSLKALQLFWHSQPGKLETMIKCHNFLADYAKFLPHRTLKYVGMCCAVPYRQVYNSVINVHSRVHPIHPDAQNSIPELRMTHLTVSGVKMWEPSTWEFTL